MFRTTAPKPNLLSDLRQYTGFSGAGFTCHKSPCIHAGDVDAETNTALTDAWMSLYALAPWSQYVEIRIFSRILCNSPFGH